MKYDIFSIVWITNRASLARSSPRPSSTHGPGSASIWDATRQSPAPIMFGCHTPAAVSAHQTSILTKPYCPGDRLATNALTLPPPLAQLQTTLPTVYPAMHPTPTQEPTPHQPHSTWPKPIGEPPAHNRLSPPPLAVY